MGRPLDAFQPLALWQTPESRRVEKPRRRAGNYGHEYYAHDQSLHRSFLPHRPVSFFDTLPDAKINKPLQHPCTLFTFLMTRITCLRLVGDIGDWLNGIFIAEQKWFAKNRPACRGRKSSSSGHGVLKELPRFTA